MGLTKKILFYIVLICIIFSSLYFLLFRFLLATPVEEQKYIRAKKIIAGALANFVSETDRITALCENWAFRNAMHDYASTPTRKFEEDQPPQLLLTNSNLSLYMVVNRDLELVKLLGYRGDKNKSITFQLLEKRDGKLWNYLLKTFNFTTSCSTIVNSQHGPILVVSSPILRSDGSGPPNGRVLMGRFVDKKFENRISNSLLEKATLLPAPLQSDKECLFPEEQSIIDVNIKSAAKNINREYFYSLVEDKLDHIVVTYPLRDDEFRYVFLIRVEVRKEMFEILAQSNRLFFLLLIGGFLLLGTVLYYFIDHTVVRPVKAISLTTNNIFTLDDLSLRIEIESHDEIASLSKNINKMLLRLQTENTKKEEVERMLVLNDKLIYLGRVSSTIAHEINNPLFAIANFFQLIKKYLPTGNKRLNDVVDIVDGEIKRVRNIIINMHKLSIRNIEEPSLSDIPSIVKAAVKVVQWGGQLRHTEIDFKKEQSSFPLYCNPDTLQQVFMNMIINAVDAMEGKGLLIIDVTDEGDTYKIEFIDQGPGISQTIKEDIFEPFKTSKKGKGSGLGLHISNNIIINHGGSIFVDDTYEDGANFVIQIPKKGGLLNEQKQTAVANR
ncbi:MAG: HAMP domain-containing protein [bacterium]|nr:HAMP domain-containing protein [bacterium]